MFETPCVRSAAGVLLTLMAMTAASAAPPGYQRPPREILEILHAPTAPNVVLSPTRGHVLLVQTEPYPPITDLSLPYMRLAGLRVNPTTNGPHGISRISGMSLQALDGSPARPVRLPSEGRPGLPIWSPDGRHFAFSVTLPNQIVLYVGSAATADVRLVSDVQLNAAYGAPFRWMPGSKEILCKTIPARRGSPPTERRGTQGPRIQESQAKAAPARTFQDLLQNAHEEDLFEYYSQSQLVLADLVTDRRLPIGTPDAFARVDPAPNGRYLLVIRTHRPYSYLLPASAFPREILVWDLQGRVVKKVGDLPLADGVPIEGVPTGPRDIEWVSSRPATLFWAEALDGGDPRAKAVHRDELKLLDIGSDEPRSLTRTEQRFLDITFGSRGEPSLLADYDRDRRRRRTFVLDLDRPGVPPRLVWDRSIQDRYKDPGTPLVRTTESGHPVLASHEGRLFLAGNGATPSGDRPFLDRFDLKTGQSERLFHCPEKAYEAPVALLDPEKGHFLTRHETPTDPPNYLVRGPGGLRTYLTSVKDPTPQLRGITKRLITYKRSDGVPLSMTLYLPAGYKEGQRLPALLWAYPLEFTDSSVAGQVSGSPYRFTTLTGTSHLFLLTQGYAILDGATMPVVGSPEQANDSYVEQIVASARAAIAKGDELGVIDPKRVGVGGHSYGAFMTANLLAHSDLFRAGIARSGAYNRTLTPFGFQAERRTLWEAPKTYLEMSPFMAAHKIRTPLLLIHGEADNNPGTFPIQSERMYQAVKGNGGTVRFVSLPYESHGYSARESVEHTLYEMTTWLDRYVKNSE